MTTDNEHPVHDALGSVWSTQAEVVRAFVEQRPNYESLCQEVAYILNRGLKQASIQIAAVTARAKSIESFCEKITRKQYNAPLSDITDLAGVRVVYLYKTDRPKIEQIIEKDFKVLEKVDKTDQQEDDRFGYGALHYLVRLGHTSAGARYDDLKSLTCEVQVRTVLQDAWAIVAHHLSYKQEAAVPKSLRRKLNSLSGLFETADDQFDRLREERQIYVEKAVGKMSDKKQFIQQDIDLDVLTEYLRTRFPDRDSFTEQAASELLAELRESGFTTLGKLDEALRRSEKAMLAHETANLPAKKGKTYKHRGYNPVGCVRISLNILDEAFLALRQKKGMQDPSAYTKFRELLEK